MTKRRRPVPQKPRAASPRPPAFSGGAVWAGVGLVLLNLVVYASVAHHEFVTWDDPQYILNNPHVTGGLTSANAWWALTSGYASNWHPVTWWSHMLDVEWYGLDAGAHHLTSLALHVASTLLLFGVLRAMTGAFGRSLFVAALFAVHPLHVESVAWVSERKDVLSTTFWMLTLWAYLRYTRQPGTWRYIVVFLALAVGLMAKPMLVTLPFALLLLDVWPLGRVTRENWRLLAWEKLPLLALAVASSVATIIVQRQGGAVAATTALPLMFRVENALVAYAAYIGRMCWPTGLAAVYPYAKPLPASQIAASLGALLMISALVTVYARQRPYLAVGWLWYLGTLVPVVGLVQVGSQASADRYTYIPLVGLFIIVAWGGRDLLARAPRHPRLVAGAAGLIVAVCAWLAHVQVGYWHDSTALWGHTVEVTTDNFIAQNGLGEALAQRGEAADAVTHFREAVRIDPDFPYAQNNLGVQLRRQHQPVEAVAHFREALRTRPDFPEAHNNLGNALVDAGRVDEAITHYSTALRLRPDYAEAHNGLGSALANSNRLDEATVHFSDAIRLQPHGADAYTNLGMVLARQGKLEAAGRIFSDALRINPNNEIARRFLADLEATQPSSR